VAVSANGLRWLQSRFAYRRTWSVTTDPSIYGNSQYIRGNTPAIGACGVPRAVPGVGQCVPAGANSGIEEEKLIYSATVFPYYPYTTIRVTGGFRYNLLTGY
jgi:hypothetical protein